MEIQCLLPSLYFSVAFKFHKIKRSMNTGICLPQNVKRKEADYPGVTGLAHTFCCIPVCEVQWKETFGMDWSTGTKPCSKSLKRSSFRFHWKSLLFLGLYRHGHGCSGPLLTAVLFWASWPNVWPPFIYQSFITHRADSHHRLVSSACPSLSCVLWAPFGCHAPQVLNPRKCVRFTGPVETSGFSVGRDLPSAAAKSLAKCTASYSESKEKEKGR